MTRSEGVVFDDGDFTFYLVGPLIRSAEAYDEAFLPGFQVNPEKLFTATRLFHEFAHLQQLLGSTFGQQLCEFNEVAYEEFTCVISTLARAGMLREIFSQIFQGNWPGMSGMPALVELFPGARGSNYQLPLDLEQHHLHNGASLSDLLNRMAVCCAAVADTQEEQKATLETYARVISNSKDLLQYQLGTPIASRQPDGSMHERVASTHMLAENFARLQEILWISNNSPPQLKKEIASTSDYTLARLSYEYGCFLSYATPMLADACGITKSERPTNPREMVNAVERIRESQAFQKSYDRLHGSLFLVFELAFMAPISRATTGLCTSSMSVRDLLPLYRFDRLLNAFARGLFPAPPGLSELMEQGNLAADTLDGYCHLLNWPTYTSTLDAAIASKPSSRSHLSRNIWNDSVELMRLKRRCGPLMSFNKFITEYANPITVLCQSTLHSIGKRKNEIKGLQDFSTFLLDRLCRDFYFGSSGPKWWHSITKVQPFDEIVNMIAEQSAPA